MPQLATRLKKALWIFSAVLAILICSALFNALDGLRYRQSYPPPGKIYSVSGRRMHLYCTGSGSPTLLLEAGLGDDWLSWRKVQPALSSLTRVCSYDRAGFGWSESQVTTRDSDHIIQELHALLSVAEISGPMVLIGHSAGGLHIRKYLTKYPTDVVGLVFVDASTPEQIDQLPAEMNQPQNLRWAEVETLLGIPRLRGRCGYHEWTGLGIVDSDSQALAAWLRADDCSVSVLSATGQEYAGFKASGQEVAGTGPFGSLPVLIFSEDAAVTPSYWTEYYPLSLHPVFAKTWNSLQEGLKKLSTRSQRIVARGSSHYVQVDRPDVVIAEVEKLVRTIRGPDKVSQTHGSTIVE